MKYVVNKVHDWVVYIDVTYGIPLWQVGNSSEYNGAYNMVLITATIFLVEKKEIKMMISTIHPYEIIILINAACSKSFARPIANKRSIADHGCPPPSTACFF